MILSTSTEVPIQVPNATELVGADVSMPPSHKNARQQRYPLLAGIYGDAFDPNNHKARTMIQPLLSEIMHLLDSSRQGIIVRDYAGHEVSFVRVPLIQ